MLNPIGLSSVVVALGLFSDPAAPEKSPIIFPVLVKGVEPSSPAILRNNRVEGRVIFSTRVSETGNIVEAQLLSCTTRAPGDETFTKDPVKRCEQFENRRETPS